MRPQRVADLRFVVLLVSALSTPAIAQNQPINVRVIWTFSLVGPGKIDTTEVKKAFEDGFVSNPDVRVLAPPSTLIRPGQDATKIPAAQYFVAVQLLGAGQRTSVSIRVGDVETSRFDREMFSVPPTQDLLAVLDSLGRQAARNVVKKARPKE